MLTSFLGGKKNLLSCGLSGLIYACLLYTVIGIAKLSPTLVQRAMGLIVAGHGTGWNKHTVRSRETTTVFLIWWESKPGASRHLLLYFWIIRRSVHLKKRSIRLLVMIVLLHISSHTQRICSYVWAVDKTIDIPSRMVGLINAVWG